MTPFGSYRWGRDGEGDSSPYWLQFVLRAPNYTVTPGSANPEQAPQEWRGRKWRISSFSTDREVIGTAFLALLQCLEHEARESFLFDGYQVFGPHIPLKSLKQASVATPDQRRTPGLHV